MSAIFNDVSIQNVGDIIVMVPEGHRYDIPDTAGNRFKVILTINSSRVEMRALEASEPAYVNSTWYYGNERAIQFSMWIPDLPPKEVVKDKPLISEQGKWFRDSGLAPGYCVCGVAKEVCEFHK